MESLCNWNKRLFPLRFGLERGNCMCFSRLYDRWPVLWMTLYTSYFWFSVIVSLDWYFKHLEMFFQNTWLLFQAFRDCFFKIKVMIVVFQHDQSNILKISYFSYHVSLSTYDVRCDVISLFWLILPINRCFKQIVLIFRTMRSSFKLVKMARQTIQKMIFLPIQCITS